MTRPPLAHGPGDSALSYDPSLEDLGIEDDATESWLVIAKPAAWLALFMVLAVGLVLGFLVGLLALT